MNTDIVILLEKIHIRYPKELGSESSSQARAVPYMVTTSIPFHYTFRASNVMKSLVLNKFRTLNEEKGRIYTR